jgi:hypothetical protein
MHSVELSIDDDEVENPAVEGRIELGRLVAEVCRTCLFVWFDDHELEFLPQDLPNPIFVPSDTQHDALESVAREAVAVLEKRYAEEDAQDISERMYRWLQRTKK